MGEGYCGWKRKLGYGVVALDACEEGDVGAAGNDDEFVGFEAIKSTPLVPVNGRGGVEEQNAGLEAAVGHYLDGKGEPERV